MPERDFVTGIEGDGPVTLRLGELLTFVFGGIATSVAFSLGAVIRQTALGYVRLIQGLFSDIGELLTTIVAGEIPTMADADGTPLDPGSGTRPLAWITVVFDESAAAIADLGVVGFLVGTAVVLAVGWILVQGIERAVEVVR
jgi:hypothetical protein